MLYLDIETYCELDLKRVGVYRYAAHPSFEILMCSWAYDDEPVEVAVGETAVRKIPGLWDPTVERVAHNANFERVCFSEFARRTGDVELDPGEYLPPEEWLDTLALAGENGLPRSLDDLGQVLGEEKKDKAGAALIRLFCRPNRGKRTLPEDQPEKWAQFIEYARQDTVTHRAAHRMMLPFPGIERAVWNSDQRINDAGVAVDRAMVEGAVAAAEENHAAAQAELRELTGLANPNSVQQLLGWFQAQGLRSMKDLRKETVEAKLASRAVNGDTPKAVAVRRALELRKEIALVASKKYTAALDTLGDDDRLRGQFAFYGAHTGRWSSRGVQIQNLARLAFKTDTETEAAILDLKLGLGAEPETLKKLVRSMFVGPFAVVDYSAIEARVLAWLAGEEWVLEAFRAGRDIYVETAAMMSTPGNTLDRSQGKVAVLALGYQGAITSLRAMGAVGTDDELRFLVDAYRSANRSIVEMWGRFGDVFLSGGRLGEFIRVERHGPHRAVRLPSGRAIIYRNVKPNETFWNLETKKSYKATGFDDPKRAGWRASTYGGRLTENVTQAVARDILAGALVRLHEAGYQPVAHIHDEILTDVAGISRPRAALREISAIMCEDPGWATTLPLTAEGFLSYRYKKG